MSEVFRFTQFYKREEPLDKKINKCPLINDKGLCSKFNLKSYCNCEPIIDYMDCIDYSECFYRCIMDMERIT